MPASRMAARRCACMVAVSANRWSFGTLAAACRYTIALTGTLIGGRASDLHAPLDAYEVDPTMVGAARTVSLAVRVPLRAFAVAGCIALTLNR